MSNACTKEKKMKEVKKSLKDHEERVKQIEKWEVDNRLTQKNPLEKNSENLTGPTL